MTVLSIPQIENIIQPLTVTMTGLPAKSVRVSFQGQQQPGHTIDQDLVFIYVTQEQSPQYDAFVENDHTLLPLESGDISQNMEAKFFYTRLMAVDFMCYGPNSYETAETVRFKILQAEAQAVLNAAGLYPLCGPDIPRRAPYPYDGQWWQRADLRILMNVATQRETIVGSLASATISLNNEDGEFSDIDIQE